VKKVLCIFAHPDDESFGPGGTIYIWAKKGIRIHLLCATRGQAGVNHTSKKTAIVRSRELRNASKILGIENVSFLNFIDGAISNKDLPFLMKKIKSKILSFQPDTLMTFNLNGVSGHIDHVSVASAVTKVFNDTGFAKKIYYFTESKRFSKQIHDYFVFFPEGIEDYEADEIVDTQHVYDKKIEAIYAHKSQKQDIDTILALEKNLPKKELFKVRIRLK
jgi:LmbE family N-acetylglucosaminyl deacetylase